MSITVTCPDNAEWGALLLQRPHVHPHGTKCQGSEVNMNDNETPTVPWTNIAANEEGAITPYEDTIDTRQLIDRITELEIQLEDATDDDGPSDPDLAAELAAELALLKAFAKECEDNFEDYHHGVGLIRDSHFETYAREFADDIGATAKALRIDYTAVEFDGITYWGR